MDSFSGLSGYLIKQLYKHQMIYAGLFFLFILLAFFSKALMPGKVLSPSADLLNTPFFSGQINILEQEPLNTILFDQVYQFYPWRYFSWITLRQGILPLWNPNSYGGTPFIATMQSAVFYPINLLLTILPFDKTFVFSAILRLWIAGMFMYLLCQRYGLHITSSLISSVSFMLCGFLIVWLNHPHTNVAIWLPAVIYFLEGSISFNEKKAVIKNIIGLSFIVGVQFLGGHIETSIDILATAGIYSVIRVIQQFSLKKPFKILRCLIIRALFPIILGIGVASIQLIPFIEWLPLSAEISTRSESLAQFFGNSWFVNLIALPLYLFPNLFLNPTWNLAYWPYLLPWTNYNEQVLYIGFLPFIFAIQACLDYKRNKHPLVLTWIILLVIAFGRAFNIPIFNWLNSLPILTLERAERLRFIMAFALTILAGFGIERSWQAGDHREPLLVTIRNRSIFFCLVGLLMLFALVFSMPYLQTQFENNLKYNVLNNNLKIPSPDPVDAVEKIAQLAFNEIRWAYSLANIEMYLPVLWVGSFCLLIFVYKSKRITGLQMQIALLLLIVIDMLSFGKSYNPIISKDAFYPKSALAEQIMNDTSLFRVIAMNDDYFPDTQLLYGLSEIRGLDFPTKWFNDYMNLSGERLPWVSYGIKVKGAESPLLRVLNLKYVISSDAGLIKDNFEKRQIGNLWVGKVKDLIPRAWIAEQVIVANDNDLHLKLKDLSNDQIGKVVFLDENETQLRTKAYGSPQSQVQNIENGVLENAWMVELERDGILFVSDSYYPGWKAYIDGTETKIYRANMAFRAVEVPAGRHRIEFRFEPLSVKVGAGVSASSVLFLLIGSFWLLRISKAPTTVNVLEFS